MKLHNIIFVLLLPACAIMSTPEGGEKDTEPPQILATQPPNKSVNFDASEIVITFDEYFSLDNFNQQFFASPPLKNRIGQRIKGKQLFITINDTLKENTTYTLNFGSSIVDITENNVQKSFKYVFSTGSELDSLGIAGSVADAYTGLAEKGLIAMLFFSHRSDSAMYKERPDYYSITDDEGAFAIENLAADTFRLVVIKDENLNLKYDSGVEKIGFTDTLVVAGEAGNIKIRTFKEVQTISLTEARLANYGNIQFIFNDAPIAPQIRFIGTLDILEKKETTFLVPNTRGDTINYWYNPEVFPKDIRTAYFQFAADNFTKDSVRVPMRELKTNKAMARIAMQKVFTPRDSIVIKSITPIMSVEDAKILLIHDGDTTTARTTQHGPHTLAIDKKLKLASEIDIIMLEGAITDMFGQLSDSSFTKIMVPAEDQLAILRIKLTSADSLPKIAQFTNKEGKPLLEFFFTQLLDVNLDNMPPEAYGLRIIWDTNQNKRWDAGIISTKTQPEKVAYYPKTIELRANWELEVVWEIPAD